MPDSLFAEIPMADPYWNLLTERDNAFSIRDRAVANSCEAYMRWREEREKLQDIIQRLHSRSYSSEARVPVNSLVS